MNFTLKSDIERLKLPKRLKKYLIKKTFYTDIAKLLRRASWTCPKCLNRTPVSSAKPPKSCFKTKYLIRSTSVELYPGSVGAQCLQCKHITYFKKIDKNCKWLFIFQRMMSRVRWYRLHNCKREIKDEDI